MIKLVAQIHRHSECELGLEMKSPDSDFQAGSFRMGCRDCTVQTCQTKGVILQKNTLVFLQGRRHIKRVSIYRLK